jgi:hypothetical protein
MGAGEVTAQSDLQVTLRQARAVLDQGDWQKAAALYMDVMKQDPSVSDGYYGFGEIALLHRHNLALAEEVFTAAVNVNPSDANSLYRLGEIAQAKHDNDNAAAFYRRALAASPRHEGALRRLSALEPVMTTSEPAEWPLRQEVLGPPRSPHYPDSLVGVVRNLHPHEKGPFSSQSLTFELTFPYRPDAGAVQVRLAGSSGDILRGAVKNGQWVELHRSAKPKKGQLQVFEMLNLDTGTPVFATLSAVKRRGAAHVIRVNARELSGTSYRGRRVRFSEHEKPSRLLTQDEREQLGAQLAAAVGGSPAGAQGAKAVSVTPTLAKDADAESAASDAPRRERSDVHSPASKAARTRPVRHRLTLAIGALALIAVAAVAALKYTSGSRSPAASAASSVQAYWNAIGGGSFRAAFDQFDSSEQDQVGGQQKFVTDHVADAPIQVQVQLGNTSVTGTSATVPIVSLETVGSHSGCARWTGTYRVREVESRWLIDAANISKHAC